MTLLTRHCSYRIIVACLLITQTLPAAAQRRRAPRGAPVVLERNIRAELGFLASDAMQGRGSAGPYERVAAEYIGSQFRQFGLRPAGDEQTAGERSFVQRVALESAKFIEPPMLTATSGTENHRWTFGRDLIASQIRMPKIAGALKVIDPDGTPAKGAALVIRSVEELDQQKRQNLARRARFAQATMLILPESKANQSLRESGTATLPILSPRPKNEPTTQEQFGVISLSKEALDTLVAMPEGTRVEFSGPTATEDSATSNAIGMLPGSDPNAAKEAIMLSAHLDHLGVGNAVAGDAIFNGADDDASGCVAVMELARALAAGKAPRRTIYFVCFGSEEAGGYGARYFIAHTPVPLERIVADVTFEMLGRPDPKVPPDTLWLTGFERSNLGPGLARHGARLVADPHPEQNFFQRSDNYALALRGVVAHTISSFGLHSDYHRPSDEIDKIDFKFMTQSISSLIGPIRWLAESTFKPAWVPGGAPTRG